jgi:hypothetical protein
MPRPHVGCGCGCWTVPGTLLVALAVLRLARR